MRNAAPRAAQTPQEKHPDTALANNCAQVLEEDFDVWASKGDDNQGTPTPKDQHTQEDTAKSLLAM